MKLKSVIIVFLVSFSLYSCKSDYDKHLEQFRECSEKKKEEKKYKYSNIQEALNAYDFATAREYLACHPSQDEFYNGDRTTSSYNFNYKPYKNDLKLIVTAEISYFISQGEFKKAETTAKEANMMEVYEKISGEGFEEKLDEMIKKKEFMKIFDFLVKKKEVAQKSSYDLNKGMSYNDSYMTSVREFNAELDKVLSKYSYLKVEKSEIHALVDLSLPELEDKNKNSSCGGCEGSKLINTYKKEATIKYLRSAK